MDTIGERIKKVRLSLGLTQKKLGELCGIAEPTIRRYELGKLNPKIGTLNKIAKALGVPVTELDPSIIPRSKFIPIGKIIESARIAQGVSVEELAKRLGISPEKIREYERGDVVPTKYIICLIADKLGIDSIKTDFTAYNAVERKQSIDEISQIYANKEDIADGKELIYDLTYGTYQVTVPFYAAGRQRDDLEENYIYFKMNTLLDKLNEEGQQKAIERVEELTEIPRYQHRTDGEEAKPDKDPE